MPPPAASAAATPGRWARSKGITRCNGAGGRSQPQTPAEYRGVRSDHLSIAPTHRRPAALAGVDSAGSAASPPTRKARTRFACPPMTPSPARFHSVLGTRSPLRFSLTPPSLTPPRLATQAATPDGTSDAEGDGPLMQSGAFAAAAATAGAAGTAPGRFAMGAPDTPRREATRSALGMGVPSAFVAAGTPAGGGGKRASDSGPSTPLHLHAAHRDLPPSPEGSGGWRAPVSMFARRSSNDSSDEEDGGLDTSQADHASFEPSVQQVRAVLDFSVDANSPVRRSPAFRRLSTEGRRLSLDCLSVSDDGGDASACNPTAHMTAPKVCRRSMGSGTASPARPVTPANSVAGGRDSLDHSDGAQGAMSMDDGVRARSVPAARRGQHKSSRSDDTEEPPMQPPRHRRRSGLGATQVGPSETTRGHTSASAAHQRARGGRHPPPIVSMNSLSDTKVLFTLAAARRPPLSRMSAGAPANNAARGSPGGSGCHLCRLSEGSYAGRLSTGGGRPSTGGAPSSGSGVWHNTSGTGSPTPSDWDGGTSRGGDSALAGASDLGVGDLGEEEEDDFLFDDQFEYLQQLGSGSFSTVYRVRNRADGEEYAVKASKKSFRTRTERRLLLREAEVASRLGEHKHVVRYFRAWQDQRFLYLQVELCSQGTLRHFAELECRRLRQRALPEAAVWAMTAQLADGLAHIHAAGLIHLDVKPENIFVAADGTLKIGDLGLAVAPDEWEEQEGDAVYIAPELLQGIAAPPCDMFSLGLVCYELAAGVLLPTEAPTGTDAWHRLRQGELPFPPDLQRSALLQDTVTRCAAPNPMQRPSARLLATTALAHWHGPAAVADDASMGVDGADAPPAHALVLSRAQGLAHAVQVPAHHTLSPDGVPAAPALERAPATPFASNVARVAGQHASGDSLGNGRQRMSTDEETSLQPTRCCSSQDRLSTSGRPPHFPSTAKELPSPVPFPSSLGDLTAPVGPLPPRPALHPVNHTMPLAFAPGLTIRADIAETAGDAWTVQKDCGDVAMATVSPITPATPGAPWDP